ncbi:MAG TPA: NAD(P)/FAD-dependent oxidoreductase [Isosphaeraceae bacterium]|nr:NAD(P)/FAD-dependent oxidoreductase [Isosphaeraceae bacterium]
MSKTVVIVGAGMGGLASALALARQGFRVTVLEARAQAGGLASSFTCVNLSFDTGPYILLDRPGLAWAFRAIGLDLDEHVSLRRVDELYDVTLADGTCIPFFHDLGATAAAIDKLWPGAGRRYEAFVHSISRRYERLFPLLHSAPSGLRGLLSAGAWRDVPFLLRPLGAVLARAGLPPGLAAAVGIWTHVAGQETGQAPSPMAFVVPLIHTVGAYYPIGGMGTIPAALERAAVAAGVEMRFGTRVTRVRCQNGRVRGVETDSGGMVLADAVVSNHSGVGTYLDLVEGVPDRARRQLARLPLQSPGVCAYLGVQAEARPPYLRFRLDQGGTRCRLLVLPEVMDPSLRKEGLAPARLVAPMDHAEAERLGPAGQSAFLEQLLGEAWWRAHTGEARVVSARKPVQWGAEFQLFRNSMNPVMTTRFMRAGRLAHRSPHMQGLYLAGSATHPGQWVSFCAISGVLAAACVSRDLC